MYRVIFEHHVLLGKEQEFIKAWEHGSKIIQEQAGARGTKLFQSIEEPNTLYAMAEWQSKAARDKAMDALADRTDAHDILHHHEEFIEYYKVIASAELITAVEPK